MVNSVITSIYGGLPASRGIILERNRFFLIQSLLTMILAARANSAFSPFTGWVISGRGVRSMIRARANPGFSRPLIKSSEISSALRSGVPRLPKLLTQAGISVCMAKSRLSQNGRVMRPVMSMNSR